MKNKVNKVTEKQNGWTYESLSNPLYFNVIPEKKLNVPDTLSKYFPINVHALEGLKQKYLYGSHPYQLNDLFDCNPNLINFNGLTIKDYITLYMSEDNIPGGDVTKFYEKDKKNGHLKFKVMFHTLVFRNLGIISLTDNNFNLQMWSLYTKNRGFILNFNTHELIKEKYFHGPFPINYLNELKKIDFNDPVLNVLYQTNVKKIDWKEEKEWRIIGEKKDMNIFDPRGKEISCGKENRHFGYSDSAIKSVYLGYNIFKDLYFNKDIYQIGIDRDSLIIDPMKIKFEKKDSRTYKIIYL